MSAVAECVQADARAAPGCEARLNGSAVGGAEIKLRNVVTLRRRVLLNRDGPPSTN
jgi:hypothetical protein